ncbi:ribonuclease P protein subunit p30 isoform X1 [Phyllopteryx taeniolatus]|uniref:ribonuclease P protein subunit p30 isoform X1 n=1 Tax=Phyllopteryx taeniolatus TaxID=161469 RepID=UPI002AD41FE6|nr:ribonuclease P protein subunit p30 isoform X1 [Phyllopteryx taeniolatus]
MGVWYLTIHVRGSAPWRKYLGAANNFISHKALRCFAPHVAHGSFLRLIIIIMSVFMDLNLTFSPDKNNMEQLIDTAAHLGFSTVAVNYTFEPATKKKQAIPAPKPIDELIAQLPIVQGRSRPIRVLNRLTLVMSELSHFRPNPTEYAGYDLLAVQPTTEKLFHVRYVHTQTHTKNRHTDTCELCLGLLKAACTQLDVDVISVSVTEKLPFFFKRAPVNVAVARGLAFEVSYASAIRDATMRRYTIANAASLMQACKGKNVLLSSAAAKPLELRGPYDIINLYPWARPLLFWLLTRIQSGRSLHPKCVGRELIFIFLGSQKPGRQRAAPFSPKRAAAPPLVALAKAARAEVTVPLPNDLKVS